MAKEEIYTIPLWDAFREDTECPFCSIEHKLEQDIIDFCLSDAYMEDDFRQITNKKGFCQPHFLRLFNEKNRLGLALVTQTHMMEMLKQLEAINPIDGKKNAFLPFKKSISSSDSPLQGLLTTIEDDCYICDRTHTTMDRYLDTFFYLFKKEPEFIEMLASSKSFCMPHYIKLMEVGKQKLKDKQFDEFVNITMPNFKDNYERVLDELQWFISKFDYRFHNEPWKNSKDAPKRSIQKVAGFIPTTPEKEY